METTETEKDNKEKVVMAIMVAKKAIMAAKATMVASDSIIAHPIAIGTT